MQHKEPLSRKAVIHLIASVFNITSISIKHEQDYTTWHDNDEPMIMMQMFGKRRDNRAKGTFTTEEEEGE